jgi:hypothetical protein
LESRRDDSTVGETADQVSVPGGVRFLERFAQVWGWAVVGVWAFGIVYSSLVVHGPVIGPVAMALAVLVALLDPFHWLAFGILVAPAVMAYLLASFLERKRRDG